MCRFFFDAHMNHNLNCCCSRDNGKKLEKFSHFYTKNSHQQHSYRIIKMKLYAGIYLSLHSHSAKYIKIQVAVSSVIGTSNKFDFMRHDSIKISDCETNYFTFLIFYSVIIEFISFYKCVSFGQLVLLV